MVAGGEEGAGVVRAVAAVEAAMAAAAMAAAERAVWVVQRVETAEKEVETAEVVTAVAQAVASVVAARVAEGEAMAKKRQRWSRTILGRAHPDWSSLHARMPYGRRSGSQGLILASGHRLC